MIHQTSTLTTSFPQEVPIDPLDSLDAPLDPLGPLNIPLGQVLAPEFLSAMCSVSGDMKGGQVGYPWKGLSKCSSEMLISGRYCTPVESYVWYPHNARSKLARSHLVPKQPTIKTGPQPFRQKGVWSPMFSHYFTFYDPSQYLSSFPRNGPESKQFSFFY